MDNLLDQIRDAVDAPIDFQGQQVATVVNYAMLSVFGVCPQPELTAVHIYLPSTDSVS
jgi:hypothetical protein